MTTLDTPPVKGSVSLVYIGTDNFTAGKVAGQTMAKLLPNGGKVGIGRGSDTALNALQRTDGFKEGIKGTRITTLEPVNDKEDSTQALALANSVISANPDLAGAFGVYAYNGPAWASAIKEAKKVGQIKLVCFDATTDIINGIKEGVIDATVAQREFDMGYKSVQIIYKMSKDGKDKAIADMGVKDGVIDTGVDVITAATLKDYEAALDKKGIPHEWNTKGLGAKEIVGGMQPILQVINLCKNFGTLSALSHINLDVSPGEVVGLAGRSGSGKSVLINLLAGLYEPSSGDVYFDGRRVSVFSPHVMRALGIEVIHQKADLAENLDIASNIFLGRELGPYVRAALAAPP